MPQVEFKGEPKRFFSALKHKTLWTTRWYLKKIIQLFHYLSFLAIFALESDYDSLYLESQKERREVTTINLLLSRHPLGRSIVKEEKIRHFPFLPP